MDDEAPLVHGTGAGAGAAHQHFFFPGRTQPFSPSFDAYVRTGNCRCVVCGRRVPKRPDMNSNFMRCRRNDSMEPSLRHALEMSGVDDTRISFWMCSSHNIIQKNHFCANERCEKGRSKKRLDFRLRGTTRRSRSLPRPRSYHVDMEKGACVVGDITINVGAYVGHIVHARQHETRRMQLMLCASCGLKATRAKPEEVKTFTSTTTQEVISQMVARSPTRSPARPSTAASRSARAHSPRTKALVVTGAGVVSAAASPAPEMPKSGMKSGTRTTKATDHIPLLSVLNGMSDAARMKYEPMLRLPMTPNKKMTTGEWRHGGNGRNRTDPRRPPLGGPRTLMVRGSRTGGTRRRTRHSDDTQDFEDLLKNIPHDYLLVDSRHHLRLLYERGVACLCESCGKVDNQQWRTEVVIERTVYYLYFSCIKCEERFRLKSVPEEFSREASGDYTRLSWDPAAVIYALSHLESGTLFDKYFKVATRMCIPVLSRKEFAELERIFYVEAVHNTIQDYIEQGIARMKRRPHGSVGSFDRAALCSDGSYATPTSGKKRGGNSNSGIANLSDIQEGLIVGIAQLDKRPNAMFDLAGATLEVETKKHSGVFVNKVIASGAIEKQLTCRLMLRFKLRHGGTIEFYLTDGTKSCFCCFCCFCCSCLFVSYSSILFKIILFSILQETSMLLFSLVKYSLMLKV